MWELSHEGNKPRAREIKPLVTSDRATMEQVALLLATVPNFIPEGATLEDVLNQPGVVALLVDNVGMMLAEGITDTPQGSYGYVHITFWDGVLEGREDLCRRVAQFFMVCADLRFLLTRIPVSRARLLRFAEAVGFVAIEEDEDNVKLALMREGELNGR
jgi:hypothetical protein